MTAVADVLIAARDLIADPDDWCKGQLERRDLDDQVVARCAVGAVKGAAAETFTIAEAAITALEAAARHLSGSALGVATFNDTCSHDEILELFDRAIRIVKDSDG
jgi:hypothetical protein